VESADNLLDQARARRRDGDAPGAYGLLWEALGAEDLSYEFLAKAADLFARLKKQAPAPGANWTPKLAYLCRHTAALHLPILEVMAWREGLLLQLYAPAYGVVEQEVLEPHSGLYAFKPDVVLFAGHWRDAALSACSPRPAEQLQTVLTNVQALWKAVLSNHPCRIVQHNFDSPAWDSYGSLASRLPRGRLALLRELNLRLAQVAPPQVAILDVDQLSASFGRERWEDARLWHLAKQHPAPAALPALAAAQIALVRAGLGLTRKVLALDLDNTLWGGVIGEDGLEGIQLGPPDARGEAHQALQQYCLELKQRGVLLAVCSKNNEDDARLPFAEHEASILKLEDFAAFVANWQDKAENLRVIAHTLNVGLDSFVFLDDNPVERASIRGRLPMVAVPEVGSDPSDFIAALGRGRYFEAWSLSEEDQLRTAGYAANAQRQEVQKRCGSQADYLRELGMVCEHGPFDARTLPRVAQLVGKTNQFNLTTQRHSLEALRRLAEDPGNWTQWFRLRDRFGDFGLIGVIIAVPAGPDRLRADTFLMSCRVMGRTVEHFMALELFAFARRRGIRTLIGIYRPTPKNSMVAGLWPQFGFQKTSETAQETAFERAADAAGGPLSFVAEAAP
jgi:FkbH-like protein